MRAREAPSASRIDYFTPSRTPSGEQQIREVDAGVRRTKLTAPNSTRTD
jgi:hypothetical protein